ncbi:MAG TPA: trigger factor [Candidatus Angelobacter sp.]
MENTNHESTAEQTTPEPTSVTTEQAPNPLTEMYKACRQEITVEIPEDVVSEEQESLVKQYAKEARVPGFRKGKVPAGVVKSRFSEQIREQLLENLVPQYYRVAVMSGGYQPVSTPHITNLKAEPGTAISFTASFDVMPEFELGDYKSARVEVPEISVSDEQVETEIKGLQEQHASYDPVSEDRGLQDGDFAQVSFEARPKEEAAAEGAAAAAAANPVQMQDILVEIGAPNTVNEFNENLRGAKAGEDKTFDVAYPADFHDQRLAGKTLSYAVKVNAIKKKTLPELNDDFAKELSPEFETADHLKKAIRENLEAQLKHAAEHEGKEKLIDQLIAQHEFPVPASMVEHQIDLRLERGLRALAAQGMRKEDMKRLDFGRLRAAQAEAAIKEVRSGLLLSRIAEKEGLEVTEEELNQEIFQLAAQTHQTPDEVRKTLEQDQGVDRIRARLRSEKALNFLYSQSQGGDGGHPKG